MLRACACVCVCVREQQTERAFASFRASNIFLNDYYQVEYVCVRVFTRCAVLLFRGAPASCAIAVRERGDEEACSRWRVGVKFKDVSGEKRRRRRKGKKKKRKPEWRTMSFCLKAVI